jgi:hypothetical protein
MTSTTLLPPLRRQLLFLSLIAIVVAPSGGCARQRIEASRRSAMHQYRAHLATYAESAETPEQAARTAQLRVQVLHAEWVQRGFRYGDDWGSDKILYSAAGMGFFRGMGYLLFGLPGEMIAYAGGDNPARATRLMQDDRSSDARRRGINDLLRWDFAHNPPYLLRYREIARNDPDPYVRSVAIRALNRCRDADSRPAFVAGLSDNSPLVRLESAKALVNLPDPSAAEGLIRLVTRSDEDRDVRIAAADALGYYRRLEVARALTPRLGEHDFSVAWQARRSLRRLTGRDFYYNEAAWLEYITGPDKPFG